MMDYGQTDKASDTSLGSPAQDKPISLWHFNENTGSTAKDAFGLNDLTGTFSWTSSGQYGTPAGTFNGNGQYVSSAQRNLSMVGNFSVEAWIKPTGYLGNAGNAKIISVGAVNSEDYTLYVAGNGSVVFNITDGTTMSAVYSKALPLSTFTHVFATYNGSFMRIYINGSLKGSKTTSINARTSANANISIGNDANSLSAFNGTIDEVAIYGRALMLDEINQSYNRNFPLFGLDNSTYGAGSNITFQIEPYDGIDYGSTISSQQITVSGGGGDTTSPFWYNNATNFTSIGAGQNVLFNVTWNDTTGL